MISVWRRWQYKKYEARISASDDFEKFNQFASGPWTPEIASKLPWDILVKGPQLGNIDVQTRKVIDMEIAKRCQSHQPFIANLLAVLAILISIISLLKS
ncbi:hypothetical protein [Asticcacaulis sp. EMRT-3]|uniref:hypothetical protein n=1 Tax=Asticcacaulis sp. EMRT-3 TaxID=3040349 RepID=UPI0024AEC8E7|nr:hypothetical protein [Asticcacaulis sp. EMRT-3]MDI7774396.1 hypothetical protein [Asticcacaulis sp. EMRT-3]